MNPPQWLFRIDTRKPDEIFEHGFTPWGTMRDFLYHLSGVGYRRTSHPRPVSQLDGLISTSDSGMAVMRFFTSSLTIPLPNPPRIYLYHIRATSNFYSAALTAQDLYLRIMQDEVVFNLGTRQDALDMLDNVMFGLFSHQREWFSDGAIPREIIYGAEEVTTSPVPPGGAQSAFNPNNDPVVYLPHDMSPMILNPHYVVGQTTANENAWDPYPTIAPLHVSIPPLTYFSDSSGATASGMSFLCASADSEQQQRKKRDLSEDLVDTADFKCYIPKNTYEYSPGEKNPISLLKSTKKSPIYFEGAVTKTLFVLNLEQKLSASPAWATIGNPDQAKNHQFIYDFHSTISTPKNEKTSFSYSLTAIPTTDVSFYVVGSSVSTTNNIDQKWTFLPVKDKQGYFKISSQLFAHATFVLVKEKVSFNNRIFLMNEDGLDDNYEILYMVIGIDETSNQILLPQRSETSLTDLRLSWEFKRHYYQLVPRTGWSIEGKPSKCTYLYDNASHKIIYINPDMVTYAMRNANTSATKWNWIQWAELNTVKDDDASCKWLISLPEKKSKDFNYRIIYSFINKEILWITHSGVQWGGSFTAHKNTHAKNSFALFVIDETCEI